MDKVELAKNGDKQAFNELIEEHKFKIYKTAKAILKDEDDVCDAIQDSLIRAYKGIAKLEHNEYFSTWLTRIVINKCYDIAKKNNEKSKKIENRGQVILTEILCKGILYRCENVYGLHKITLSTVILDIIEQKSPWHSQEDF